MRAGVVPAHVVVWVHTYTMRGKTMIFDQQAFNQQVVDVLDQLVQELDRQRQGKTLSNMAGIKQGVLQLINNVCRAEKIQPQSISIK